MPRRGSRGLVLWAAAVLLTGLLTGLTGCGSASDPSPPSGVDMLEIPTPSPDPDDFVKGIDNPWLPLEPGSHWVYDLAGEDSDGTVTVSVQPDAVDVAGLAAAAVETSWPDRTTLDYYAQDRRGNVWWLGREGVWEAGVDGAEAGLAMAATPRVGDGYRKAFMEGVVEDRATVVAVDEETAELDIRSSITPDLVLRETYARGVGLVGASSVEGPELTLELVEQT